MRIRSLFVDSRVARRMLALFVLCTLVPLLLSDWLATTAVSQVARDLQQRHQVRTTRQTSLQVFDRLTAAKGLLGGLPATPAEGDAFELPPTARSMFRGVAWLDDQGEARFDRAPERGLVRAWQRMDAHDASAERSAASGKAVALRVVPEPTQAPRVLLGASSHGRLRWIAELEPSYLWAPLDDAAIDSVWRVTDDERRVLAERGDAGDGNDSSETLAHSTRLFLGAEFDAGDWEFAERRATPPVSWHGLPLVAWLALAAVATALFSALLSLGQIRRTLVPLQRLTLGARALGPGAAGVRVEIAGDDEFARLGRAFNDMAGRIDEQVASLEMLSAIDADVLSGETIERVAERVLDRLALAHPAAAGAICWLDDRRPGTLSGLRRLAGASTVGPFDGAVDPVLLDRPDASMAARLLATPVGGAVAHEVLPLAWAGRTRGLLLLGLPAATAASMRDLATELQARLAVAFSARERESEMNHRAAHDGLTGLANRHGLNTFVDAMLADADGRPAAVLFIDLDNFKDVNDSLGHEAGDRVLGEAGRRLAEGAAPGVLVARQGGDEFVMAIPCGDADGACAAAAEVVDRLGQPFEIGGDRHALGASVGVALYPAHGTTRVELMRHADAAMYAAKAAGRGRFQLFDESLEVATQARLRLPAELRHAIANGELVAHYQPRVSTISGRVTSVEALVRWQHPERGLLMPDTFIALAEESQLIEDIGLFMLDDACSRVGAWRRNGAGVLRVSVNVSPRQLSSGRLPGQVLGVLRRHGLPAHVLELEVTESLLVADATGAREQLAALRESGVTVALDDFGTGFSSMSMLRNLPIDVMKIDRAFVRDLGTDASAVAITRTIATLARALRLHLVAEGVETQEQAALLEGMGCDEFQGFLFSPPLPADGFDAFLDASCRQLRPARATRAA